METRHQTDKVIVLALEIERVLLRRTKQGYQWTDDNEGEDYIVQIREIIASAQVQGFAVALFFFGNKHEPTHQLVIEKFSEFLFAWRLEGDELIQSHLLENSQTPLYHFECKEYTYRELRELSEVEIDDLQIGKEGHYNSRFRRISRMANLEKISS